jgi:hypothetical protein
MATDIEYLNGLRERVEFYRKGSIVPQRVLKCERRKKHHITFGADCWLVPTRSGYLVLVDCGTNGSALRLSRYLQNARLRGSPYLGCTHWCGNSGMSESEYAAFVVQMLSRLDKVTAS